MHLVNIDGSRYCLTKAQVGASDILRISSFAPCMVYLHVFFNFCQHLPLNMYQHVPTCTKKYSIHSRSILDGYLNPLVFWYQWDYLRSQAQNVIFCWVSKIGHDYNGRNHLATGFRISSTVCPDFSQLCTNHLNSNQPFSRRPFSMESTENQQATIGHGTGKIITTSLRPHWKSWLIREIIPKWPYFRLVNYYNLSRWNSSFLFHSNIYCFGDVFLFSRIHHTWKNYWYWLVVTGTWLLWLSIQLGMSSSQLTNSHFSEG